MELTALGSVALAGSEFSERKPLLLLVYLALRGRRDRADVAEFLWADSDPELQRKSLSEALRKLRKLHPEAILEPEVGSLATGLPCDVARLRQLTAAAPGDDPAALAERIVAAYPAPLLHGAESDRRLNLAPGAVEWVLEARENLHTAVEEALLRCGERLARRGEFRAAAVAAALSAELPEVATFPSPDELRRRYALLLAGNSRAEADAVAAVARGVYDDMVFPTDPAAARASLDVRRELPALPDPFVGREAELREILGWLRARAARAVAITGMPGIGKSVLATAAARRARTENLYPGGVAFVSLTGLEPRSDEAEVVEYLASELVLDPPRPDAAALAGALGEHDQLLVLDETERIAHLPELLAALLRHSGATFLLGSRVRHDLEGVRPLPLRGLSTTPADDTPSEAEHLFLSVAQRRGVDLGRAPPAAIGAVAAAVEGHPLALRLAASWAQVLPLDDVAKRLGDSWDLYAASPLEDALADARDALPPEQNAVLIRLGAQRGGVAPRAARALGIDLAALRSLVANDLVRFDPLRERFTLHAVVEREAAARLAATDDAGEILDRHARYYLTRLGEVTSEDAALRESAPRRLAPEMENVEAAWRRAVAQGWRSMLGSVAHALQRLSALDGRPRWGAALLALARNAADHPGAAAEGDAHDGNRRLCRAQLDSAHAWLALLIDDYETGLRLAESVRERLDPTTEAHRRTLRIALFAAGAIHDDLGRFGEARTLFREALRLDPVDGPFTATSLLNLSVNARFRGAYRASEGYLRRALAIYRMWDRVHGQVRAAALLAHTLRVWGHPLEAIAELDAATPLLEQETSPVTRAEFFVVRAEIELDLERAEAAAASLRRVRAEGGGDWESEIRALLCESQLVAGRGDDHLDRARELAKRALRLSCEHRYQTGVAFALMQLIDLRERTELHDPRSGSLLGFLDHLARRDACRAEVRQAFDRFAARREPISAAPPPWTEAALREPRMILERVGVAG